MQILEDVFVLGSPQEITEFIFCVKMTIWKSKSVTINSQTFHVCNLFLTFDIV